MKYYHIIYNSSEKNRRGMSGFGIRTVTEGTPDEVLAALQSAEVFNFDTSRPMLTPPALKENPEKIKDVPSTYFYTVVPVPGSQPIYVLGRKIAVGFDYVYYKDFKAGRLGNYVVDCYAFTQVPDASAFELLTENPAPGSHHFIPASPVPSPHNEEMAAISLGAQPDLPLEERSFKAAQLPPIDGITLELMFAYIEAHNEGKPLLINGSINGTAAIMSQFYRLLPPSMLGEVTFLTNHQSEGRKKGYNILEKNELYPYQVFAKQFVTFDLKGGQTIDTIESRGYREPLRHAIEQGDLDTVHSKLKWLFSHAYAGVKGHSQATIDHLYNYYVDHQLDEEALYADEVFLAELGKHLKAHPEDRYLIDRHVEKAIVAVSTPDEVMVQIAHLHKLREHIDLNAVIAAGQPHMTQVVLASVDAFKQFYTRCDGKLEAVSDYIDLTQLPRHEAYLSAFHGREWIKLSDRFLPNHRQELPLYIARTFTDGLDEQTRDMAITGAQSDASAILDACSKLLHSSASASFEQELLDYIEGRLLNRVDTYNFFGHFPAQRDDERYTPLFDWQIRKTMPTNLTGAVDMMCELSTSEAMRRTLTADGGQTLVLLCNHLEKQLVTRPDSRSEVSTLSGRLLDSYRNVLPQRYLTQLVAISNVAANVTDNDEWESDEELQKAQALAIEMKDTAYLTKLLPVSLRHEQESGWVNSILNLGVIKSEELMKQVATLPTTARDFYYRVILSRAKKFTGTKEMEKLQQWGGLTLEEAKEFLATHFPEAHALYLKSLEPTIVDKVGGFFKKMFNKKQPDDQQ